MIEHRLIERMIKVMAGELERLGREKKVDHFRLDTFMDFIRTYADRCHHGKEEDILFRELRKKDIRPEHREVMEELIQEHRWGRQATRRLVEASQAHRKGDAGALEAILACLRELSDFYPRHIEKEDRHFFLPVMRYFNPEEKKALLEEGFRFDQNLIHEKYRQIVIQTEEEVKE